MPEYSISTERTRLDLEFIVRSLRSTYWAGDRSREDIVASVEASLCFGAYASDTGQHVGFARVVTDGVTFSWLCDVFVDPAHRAHGLGKRLVEAVLAHPQVARTRVYLGTRDAHGLYEKYGFVRWELMRRPIPPPAPGDATPGADPARTQGPALHSD